MPPLAHTSREFDTEIERIRAQVLEMGVIVEYQVRYAVEALRTGDRNLVARVIQDETRVNALECTIDEACTEVVVRRQPAANDLRFLMMVYKTVVDLERIGDEAKKIALAAQRLSPHARNGPGAPEIRFACSMVVDMLRRALGGIARLDPEVAPAVARLDEEVDAQFRSIVRQLLTYMIEDPRTISPALEALFVAKALERVGDHAKNIAEYVVYMIKGKDVRHVSLEEIEDAVKE
jgi:phosphate transport system protein